MNLNLPYVTIKTHQIISTALEKLRALSLVFAMLGIKYEKCRGCQMILVEKADNFTSDGTYG